MIVFDYSYLLFELISAIAGSLYISKYREDKNSRYFVWFLWITFAVELFGTIPSLIYYFDLFPSLKGTFLESNDWLFNVFFIFNFCFYVYYFSLNYKTKKLKNFMIYLAVIYALGSVVNLLLTDVYFNSISSFTYTVGTILLFFGGILYLFEMLQSDNILVFYRTIPFYIAIGSMIFHLAVTPLFIYDKYYVLEKNPELVKVSRLIFNTAIIFLYSCYTIGFVVCNKNKSY